MKLQALVICTCLALSGCNSVFHAIATQPGNALADKQEGPVQLASATPESLAGIFPLGTSKAVITQTLGTPGTSMNNSNGTSQQIYQYTFTSHRQKVMKSRVALMEYDKASKLTKLTLTNSDQTLNY